MTPDIITYGAVFAAGAGAAWLWMRWREGEFDPGLHPDCTNCGDSGWVCENHPDTAWSGLTGEVECCGGAGAPCPCCEWELATSGIRDEADRAHSRLSDAHNTQSARIERAREYCDSNFRVRGAVVADILNGDA